jgi:RNA polymerase sigma-70 factor, ECF subfamily
VRTTAEGEAGPSTAAGSFDEFFRLTFPRVARTTALAVGDFDLGQDLAQEGFTRLYQRWGRMESEAHATNFAYRVALNLARSHLRKEAVLRRLRVRREDEAEGMPDEADRTTDRLTLAGALAGLSPRQRTCVALVDYAGFDSEAAGALLGLRSSTVRVHLTRGRRALAERLGTTYRGGTDDE